MSQQCCKAVLRQKSSLRIFRCNITLIQISLELCLCKYWRRDHYHSIHFENTSAPFSDYNLKIKMKILVMEANFKGILMV